MNLVCCVSLKFALNIHGSGGQAVMFLCDPLTLPLVTPWGKKEKTRSMHVGGLSWNVLIDLKFIWSKKKKSGQWFFPYKIFMSSARLIFPNNKEVPHRNIVSVNFLSSLEVEMCVGWLLVLVTTLCLCLSKYLNFKTHRIRTGRAGRKRSFWASKW